MHDLACVSWVGSVLQYTGPAQHLVQAGWDLSVDLSVDYLSDARRYFYRTTSLLLRHLVCGRYNVSFRRTTRGKLPKKSKTNFVKNSAAAICIPSSAPHGVTWRRKKNPQTAVLRRALDMNSTLFAGWVE